MMASTSSHHALPAALDKLLADLAASSTSNRHSLTHLPYLGDRDKYGDFFRPSWMKDVVEMGDERRWQVRLQLLTAIGRCPTLKSIELDAWYEIGEEREEEVEALLGGLAASNTVLEVLVLTECLVSEASCRGPLGSLLRNNTRTLHTLTLTDADVDAAGLGHLVQALLANPDRVALRTLGLIGNKAGDAAGAAHVAALLKDNALPALSELRIRNIGLDMEGAHLIARALATNSTLEDLWLGGFRDENEAVALVLQLGLGEIPNHDSQHSPHSSNRSIKSVRISYGDHICLNGLMAAMRTNNVLEKVEEKVELSGLVLLDSNELASSIKAWLENSESAMRHLDLSYMQAPKSVKLAIFMALRSNRTVVEFSMYAWRDLDHELFGCLMHTLLLNTTLCTIDMESTSWKTWKKEGMGAYVRQHMWHNAFW